MTWGVEECKRIEVALRELGYPPPVRGMPQEHALKLVADAVEDLAKKLVAAGKVFEQYLGSVSARAVTHEELLRAYEDYKREREKRKGHEL